MTKRSLYQERVHFKGEGHEPGGPRVAGHRRVPRPPRHAPGCARPHQMRIRARRVRIRSPPPILPLLSKPRPLRKDQQRVCQFSQPGITTSLDEFYCFCSFTFSNSSLFTKLQVATDRVYRISVRCMHAVVCEVHGNAL